MNDIKAIIYTSETGHTKEYALLLRESIGQLCYPLDRAIKKKIARGCGIIYMGWIRAGVLHGYKQAAKYYDIKAVCAVGMGSGGEQLSVIRENNKIPESIPLFYLPGGYEPSKLGIIDAFAMKLFAAFAVKRLSEKAGLTPAEEESLRLLKEGGSLVDKSRLYEVVEWYLINTPGKVSPPKLFEELFHRKEFGSARKLTDEELKKIEDAKREERRKRLAELGMEGIDFEKAKSEAYRRHMKDGVYVHDYNAPTGSIDNPVEVGMEGCCTTLFFDGERGYWGLTDGLGNGWLR